MNRILILGGGLSGYYVARGLEGRLRAGEAEVTLVDMRSACVYQPFLAEVASGAIEPRHIETPFAMHLRRTRHVRAKVVGIDSAARKVEVADAHGNASTLGYDTLVVALGGVTRTFPIPGIAENAVGLKATEEAVYLRDNLIHNLGCAASLPKGSAERARLATLVCVGGGFSGMEGFAELYDLARRICRRDPRLDASDLNFHLIEATEKVFPELTARQAGKAVAHLERLGAHVHLRTCVESAEGGRVETSDGASYDAALILWCAGAMANPVLRASDLPLERDGRVTCGADLRVRRDGEVLEGVFAAGDCACVPDLTGRGLPDGSCAPTAQHSMRQSKVLVRNLLAYLRAGGADGSDGSGGSGGSGVAGETTGKPETAVEMTEYRHENAGMVAGLGAGYGAFTSGALTKGGAKVRFNGWLAWMAHRVYHGLALPGWERKFRVWGDWTAGLVFRRDLGDVIETRNPRGFFEEFAARGR